MDPLICSFSAREDLIAQIVRFVLREPAIGALTGEAGSGKSTLLEQVSNQLWNRARVLRLFPPAKRGEIRQQLASQLGIDCSDKKAQAPGELAGKLVGQHLEKGDPEKPTVVLCDDADQYRVSELEELRLLSNYPLCIILCGQDSLFKHLRRGSMGPLQQRITAFFPMPRLSWKETPAFLHCAVRSNPGGAQVQERVPEEVAKRLFKLSGGLPGFMMELVDGALISASYRGDPALALSDIPRGQRFAKYRRRPQPLITGFIATLFFAGVIAGLAALYFTAWHGPAPVPAPAEPMERISFKMDQISPPELPAADQATQEALPASPQLDLIFESDEAAIKFLFPDGESKAEPKASVPANRAP
jgi:type II secretory pathway predicted ATPase ExeA